MKKERMRRLRRRLRARRRSYSKRRERIPVVSAGREEVFFARADVDSLGRGVALLREGAASEREETALRREGAA